MRYAASLFVIAVGGILAFAVADAPDDSIRVHAIGVILILTGLVGLAMARQLFVSRRRTDVIYREDGATWLEPNVPAHSEPWELGEPHVPTPPPDPYAPTVHAVGAPGVPLPQHPQVEALPEASVVQDPHADRVERVVHGVMDVEPGSAEFRRLAERYDD